MQIYILCLLSVSMDLSNLVRSKFQHQLNWLGSCQPTTTYPIFCHRRVHGVHMMQLTYANTIIVQVLFSSR